MKLPGVITDAEICALLFKYLNSLEDDWQGRKVVFVMQIFGRRFQEVLERAMEER